MTRPWLLLRGLVRDQRHWGSFPQDLARATGAEVHTLDLPGVGTERHRAAPTRLDDVVDDLRARLPVSRPRLFAVSFGGMIGLRWAERYPEELHHLVVCNTSAREVASPLERFSPQALSTLARAVLATDPLRRERIMLALVSNTDAGRAHAPVHAAYVADAPLPRAVVFRQLRAASGATVPTTLAVPLTVLASEGDRLASHHASRRLAERLSAPLHLHKTAGHDLPLDDGAWVIDRLRAIAP